MDAHDLNGLLAEHLSSGRPYLEFLRSESMSIGLYVLNAGDVDGQQPHAEDEAYVVLGGRSRFTAGDETRDIAAGDVIYEPKWDGFRAIVFRDGDSVEIGSRNEKPLTRYFPELVEPLRASLPERAVVDGEVATSTRYC